MKKQTKANNRTRINRESKVEVNREQLPMNQGLDSVKWPYLILLFLIPFITFLNSSNGLFVLDDTGIIGLNKLTTAPFSLQNVADIFSRSYRDGTPGNFENELYRPFTKMVFNLLYNISGQDTSLYHWINILLYCLLVVLSFIVISKVFRSQYTYAFLVGILFSVHPIHCEAVANIKGLEEILSLFFLLTSIYFALKYERNAKVVNLIWVCFFFSCALFSKESSVLGILLIPLCIYFSTRKWPEKKLLVGIVSCTVLFLCVRYVVLQQYDHIHVSTSKLDNIMYFTNDGGQTNWPMRLGTAFFLQGFALYKMAWPVVLSCDYNFAGITTKTFQDWEAWLGLIMYLGMILMAWKTYRKYRFISFGLWWYLISSLLTSNLFLVIGTSVADRLLFTPGWGLIIAFIGLLGHLFKYQIGEQYNWRVDISKNKLLYLVVFLISLPLAKLCYSRNAEWQSNTILYQADLAKYPETVKMQRSLAQSLSLTEAKDGIATDSVIRDNSLAIHYFSNAYEHYPHLTPDDWYLYGKCYLNLFLAEGMKNMNNLDSAEQLFKMANRVGYKFESCESDLARVYFIKFQQDKTNKALIDTALLYGFSAYEKNPKSITIVKNIGAFYGPKGKIDSGILWLEKAWNLDSTNPENITTAKNMAKLYQTQGNEELARLWNEKAARLQR